MSLTFVFNFTFYRTSISHILVYHRAWPFVCETLPHTVFFFVLARSRQKCLPWLLICIAILSRLQPQTPRKQKFWNLKHANLHKLLLEFSGGCFFGFSSLRFGSPGKKTSPSDWREFWCFWWMLLYLSYEKSTICNVILVFCCYCLVYSNIQTTQPHGKLRKFMIQTLQLP